MFYGSVDGGGTTVDASVDGTASVEPETCGADCTAELVSDAGAPGNLFRSQKAVPDAVHASVVAGEAAHFGKLAAEWWDPRRNSVETMVHNAQVFVRHGLSPVPPAKTRRKR